MLPFDPKKPLCGFTMRAPHAKRRIHLFVDEEEKCIYFRPKNAPDDWWGSLWPHVLYSRVENRQFFQVQQEIHQGHFFRVLMFDDEINKQTFKVWFHPRLIFISLNFQLLEGVFFFPRSPCRINLWKAETSEISSFMDAEWQDKNSDVHQAIQFLSASEDERNWLAVGWKNGSRQELQMALLSAFWLDKEIWGWWKNEKLVLQWTRELWVGVGNYWRDARIYGLSKLSLHLQELVERIKKANASYHRLPHGRRDHGAPPWWVGYEEHMPNRMTSIMLPITPPTRHERMEAALFLRDWLRENAPDLLPDWFPDER